MEKRRQTGMKEPREFYSELDGLWAGHLQEVYIRVQETRNRPGNSQESKSKFYSGFCQHTRGQPLLCSQQNLLCKATAEVRADKPVGRHGAATQHWTKISCRSFLLSVRWDKSPYPGSLSSLGNLKSSVSVGSNLHRSQTNHLYNRQGISDLL